MRYTLLLSFLTALCLGQNVPAGKQHFATRCSGCHGGDGRGGERGPDITHNLAGRPNHVLANLVRAGIPGRGMPATNLTAAEMADLLAYMRTIARADGNQVRAKLPGDGPTFEQIRNPKPGEWPSYNGNLSGNRHSPLKQIDAGNVAGLAPKWLFSVPGSPRLQVTPVVLDGVMYVTAVNEAHALDARDGRVHWSFRRPRTPGLAGDAASGINRGVAVLGNRVFLVTDNAHILALDRTDGHLLWDTEMADPRQNYGATSAPLVVKNLVITGISGGDEGVRGFISAYNVETGKEAWRFWTVPQPDDPAAKTWEGKDIEHGCATGWFTGSYDAETDTLFWTAGNPCPDYNGDERRGDNLYSNSVLALNPETGQKKWHYQFTPHDLHDWDSTQPVLAVNVNGRKLLLQANRNGFFYVLERDSGKLQLAKAFVEKLTWASEIGSDGRPVLKPDANPTPQGTRACPAVDGATNWYSSAYLPSTGLFYVQANEKCTIFLKSPDVWKAGESYYGGSTRRGEPGKRYLRALDISTGRKVWEVPQEGQANTWGGVLATDGGLVFFGDDSGDFAAVDAKSGRRLWRFPANQLWKASPMTYMAGGKQYVAIAAGPNVLVFGLP